MMTCDVLSRKWGFTCEPVSDGLIYAESPFLMVGDGSHLGAYIQNIGRDKVRLSDNSDTLFNAMTYGVQLRDSTLSSLQSIAESRGLSVSEQGELFAVCDESRAGEYFARFLEASFMFGEVLHSKRPEVKSNFESHITKILLEKYGPRITKDRAVTGASGHEIKFPLCLDAGKSSQQFIQTISAKADGSVNWKSVYQATGKFLDLKNNDVPGGRVVVLEPTSERQSTAQAELLLQNSARVIEFIGTESLIRELSIAA